MSALPLAVVRYGQDDEADSLFERFARALMAQGVRVAGLVQINGERRCEDKQMALEDLASGRLVNICQDLGPGAGSSCRIDPVAVSEAAGLMRSAITAAVDLVIINKYGKLESEGAGLLDEISAVIAAQKPLLIGVSDKFIAAWNGFAQGLDTQIPCTEAAMAEWWQHLQAKDHAA